MPMVSEKEATELPEIVEDHQLSSLSTAQLERLLEEERAAHKTRMADLLIQQEEDVKAVPILKSAIDNRDVTVKIIVTPSEGEPVEYNSSQPVPVAFLAGALDQLKREVIADGTWSAPRSDLQETQARMHATKVRLQRLAEEWHARENRLNQVIHDEDRKRREAKAASEGLTKKPTPSTPDLATRYGLKQTVEAEKARRWQTEDRPRSPAAIRAAERRKAKKAENADTQGMSRAEREAAEYRAERAERLAAKDEAEGGSSNTTAVTVGA